MPTLHTRTQSLKRWFIDEILNHEAVDNRSPISQRLLDRWLPGCQCGRLPEATHTAALTSYTRRLNQQRDGLDAGRRSEPDVEVRFAQDSLQIERIAQRVANEAELVNPDSLQKRADL